MIAKSAQGLLAAGVPPAEILRQAALFGARNRDGWGIGLTILTALGNLLPLLPAEDTSPEQAAVEQQAIRSVEATMLPVFGRRSGFAHQHDAVLQPTCSESAPRDRCEA